MREQFFEQVTSVLLVCCTIAGCNEPKKDAVKPQASAVAAPSAVELPKAAELAPAGCKATGSKAIQIGTILGDVYGFAEDATHLYYTTWQVYGGRGELGKIRKDGQGSQGLAPLKLEPRGLAVDKDTVFYTAGIRLMGVPKDGGTATTIEPQFSSQSVAVDDAGIYGVPGDYGPYDRVAKIGKKGGAVTELASTKRPASSIGPNGYTSMALDQSGVYVADAGNGRVLRFPLAGGKPQPIATGVKKPFDLAIDESNVYFSLAAGELMKVSKAGGRATKLASGLVEKARIAADTAAVYTTRVAKNEGAKLTKVLPTDGTQTEVASIPESHLVSAIALDHDCVYWVERADATKGLVYALAR